MPFVSVIIPAHNNTEFLKKCLDSLENSSTKNIEIIGSRVIPEFGTYAVFILGISIFGLVYFARKSEIGFTWTRIN